MERFNERIKKEVFCKIKKWCEKDMTLQECEIYFENCCSIWDGYEELIFYFNEDGETISMDELKNSEWCQQLSDGKVIMFG